MTEEDLMLTSLFNCRLVDLFTGPKTLSDEQQSRYNQMLARRATGEPLQYILGHCDFMGIPLAIDHRALIPRPETEILADLAVGKIKNSGHDHTVNILDLGTGSGNVAIALAKYIEQSFVRTVDISREAIDLARRNARSNGVAQKIDFYCQDMAEYLKKAIAQNTKFDVVISNPPYIPTAGLSRLPQDVQKEPRAALDGGVDGTRYHKVIFEYSYGVLKPEGFLFIEIGDGQRGLIQKLLNRYPQYQNINFHKDYAGTDRIVSAQWKN